jgi:putative ABC transport system substrate-binding protein
MNRRAFTGNLALGILVVHRTALAQPARKVPRIGILGLSDRTADLIGPEPRNPSISAFVRGLRELGYVYGKHFVTEPRGAEGKPERFPSLAAELIGLRVDVIVASGPALSALKQATATIPVVMAAFGDPEEGIVQSLAHPGWNFTGLSLQREETTGKRLELLKEIVPAAAPVAVLWERSNLRNWHAAENAARKRTWKLLSLEIRDAGEIEGAFRTAADARAGSLLVITGGHLYPHTRQIVELAARTRLPAMYELRPYVEAGGLISYGADLIEVWRRAAVFVDKLLKGTKPADIPIEQPTKFALVINLNAAKALGLAIPQSILLRADEVIQ